MQDPVLNMKSIHTFEHGIHANSTCGTCLWRSILRCRDALYWCTSILCDHVAQCRWLDIRPNLCLYSSGTKRLYALKLSGTVSAIFSGWNIARYMTSHTVHTLVLLRLELGCSKLHIAKIVHSTLQVIQSMQHNSIPHCCIEHHSRPAWCCDIKQHCCLSLQACCDAGWQEEPQCRGNHDESGLQQVTLHLHYHSGEDAAR